MDFAEFAYLIDIIRLHCHQGGILVKVRQESKLTTIRWLLHLSKYSYFSLNRYLKRVSERRSLIDQRVTEVLRQVIRVKNSKFWAI